MTELDEALRALEKKWLERADHLELVAPCRSEIITARSLRDCAAELAALLTTRQEVAPVADGLEFFAAPEALHPATANLVARFASALAEKLATAERKYGYSDGWASPDWMDECRAKLMEHVAKGDPRDVAAYCAFLWHHGESTSTGQTSDARDGVDWKAQYRFQTAMRYMDNNDKMTLERAQRMADEDIVRMERAAMKQTTGGGE